MLRLTVSLILAAGLALAGYILAYIPLQSEKERIAQRISSYSDEIATMDLRLATLRRSNNAITYPEDLIWKARSKPEAELALQDIVIGLAEQHDISLIIFGASPIHRDTSQPVFGFEIEAESSLDNLYQFLAALEEVEPKVTVGSLRVRRNDGIGEASDELAMYQQLTLWGFWEVQE